MSSNTYKIYDNSGSVVKEFDSFPEFCSYLELLPNKQEKEIKKSPPKVIVRKNGEKRPEPQEELTVYKLRKILKMD